VLWTAGATLEDEDGEVPGLMVSGKTRVTRLLVVLKLIIALSHCPSPKLFVSFTAESVWLGPVLSPVPGRLPRYLITWSTDPA
jgi:hypothetical protein